MDSSKTSNQCSWRRRRRSNHSASVTRGGRLLRDKGRIRERWVRFFRSLLNNKSDMLHPDIPKRLPQHLVASALGIEPTEEEIATAMKAMANAKKSSGAVRSSLGTAETRTSTRPDHPASTALPPSSSVREKYHSRGKTRSLPYSTRRVARRSAETTAASRLCCTRVRCSLKWLPEDSALTVRRRDCFRRSSAGFGRITPPRT